jgi:hypothetical protein
LLLLSLLAVALPGCKRRPAAAPVSTQPALPPNPEKDLSELTMAVRAYYLSQGKHPATLDDLVQARCIYVLPTPPPGKKYVIDAKKMEAALVDQ